MSRLFPRLLTLIAVGFLTLATGWHGAGLAAGEAGKSVYFEFTDLEGQAVRLKDFQGKWVLVNFWATWCPLCKASVPTLNELDRRPDLAVIGICLDYGDKIHAVRDAVQQFDMRFHANVAAGSRKSPNSPHRQVGPVDFFPTSYLFAPNGEIVMFIPGQVRAAKVLAFMENWRPGRLETPVYAMNTSKLATTLKQQFGNKGNEAYQAWRKLVEQANADQSIVDKLGRVNTFFNQRIQVASDQQVWRRDEYWATPGEVLGAGRGDSEDFAIAKYFTLLAMNIPAEQLRLVYTRPGGTEHSANRRDQNDVHIVVAYYAALDREPLLLDHRLSEVVPASRRPDLRPVYTFNSLGIWGDLASAGTTGSNNRLAIWEDTLRRARLEGFE